MKKPKPTKEPGGRPGAAMSSPTPFVPSAGDGDNTDTPANGGGKSKMIRIPRKQSWEPGR